jgi:hypothetical protein
VDQRELVAGLRRGVDGVARGRHGADGEGRQARAEVRDLGRTGARHRGGVRVLVDVAGLHLGDGVAGSRLGSRVLALGTLAEERGQSDRGEDADDQDDHEQLDQGEALLVARAVAQLVEHEDEPS